MAIDMTTVTAITHNNKDVVKIEDNNGNVLWEKPAPAVRQTLYYIKANQANYYEVDLENKTYQSLTATGTSNYATSHGSGSSVIGFGPYANYLYVLDSGTAYSLQFSDTVRYFLKLVSWFPSGTSGNNSYSLDDGYCYISNGINNPTETYRIDSSGNVTNMSTIWSNQMAGNNVIKYRGKFYGSKYKVTADNQIYEYSNGDWVLSTMSRPPVEFFIYNLWAWNGRLFLDSGSDHYEYNPTTNTWSQHTWVGSGNFNAARVFTDGVDCYMVGGTSTAKTIYKLSNTADWFTSWMTFPEAIRGDLFINQKGSAQLAQNARPKKA